MKAVNFSLRNVLLFITLLCAIVFFTLALVSHYYTQRQFLLENTRQANAMYASKMADILDIYLQDAKQVLAFSADYLQQNYAENQLTSIEAERLIKQSRYFNSVVMADNRGVIIASAPASLNLNGKQLQTVGSKQSLLERVPLISSPFYSAVGNYIISISTPVFDQANEYKGFISGTLHLQRGNILSELLAHHFASAAHRIYIYDSNEVLIYHSNPDWIGKSLVEIRELSAAAGFFQHNTAQAVSKKANWQVVIERSEASLQHELVSQVISAIRYLLPATILLGIVIWWLAAKISAPLKQLVNVSNDFALIPNRANYRKIHSPITEIRQLKMALLRRSSDIQRKITLLDKASQTDPLTNIANRRGLELYAASIQEKTRSRAVLAIDIDHFKKVNDNYGHDCGDKVLKQLASVLCKNTRAEDLVCRIGGEEFLIITEQSLSQAAELAERIRTAVPKCQFGLAETITISIGVATWQPKVSPLDTAVKKADMALYQAKNNGRNQVIVYTESSSSKRSAN